MLGYFYSKKMRAVLFTCMCVWFAGLYTGECFSVSNCSSTSSGAQGLCTLAEPSIKFTTGLTDELEGIDIDQSLWIGYKRVKTAFLYKGCFNKDHVTPIKTRETVAIRPDPGHCYSFCKTITIGVKVKRTGPGGRDESTVCYCIPSKVNTSLDATCIDKCSNPRDTFCGEHSNHWSLYERVDLSTAFSTVEKTTSNQCLTYDSSTQKYIWNDCGTKLLYLCKNSNGSLVYSTTVFKTWLDGIKQCFENANVWIDLATNLSSIEGKISPLWTGVVWSYSVYNVTDTSVAGEDYEQGFVEKDSPHNLLFEAADEAAVETHRHALCMGGDTCPTAPPPITESTVTSQESTSTTHTVNTQTNRPPSKPTSSASTTHEQSNTNDASAQTNNQVGVYVAVPLAIVIVVAVVGFLIWWKRRRTASKESKQHDKDKSYIDNREIPKSVNNGHHSGQAPDTVRHDYFVLEPADEYAAIKDTELDDTADGDYDTTKGATMDTNDTGNIYNRLDGDPDDTYNHTHTNNTRDDDDTYNHTNTNNTRDDDTYNHTNTCATDTTYNTTETLSRSKQEHGATTLEGDYNTLNNDDDTYNHLNGDLPKQGINPNEDDTYNHPDEEMGNPKQVAHEYSYVEPSSTNPPPPNPGHGNMKYDYAYATKGATNGSTKPAMFKIDQLPNAGSYELAKEPPTSVNYELAKPPGV